MLRQSYGMLDELHNLLGVRVCLVSQKEEREVRDLLAGDLPDSILLFRNGHDDQVAHATPPF
jgi:hypothetical protein